LASCLPMNLEAGAGHGGFLGTGMASRSLASCLPMTLEAGAGHGGFLGT
jgi:hypothetical protein